MLLHVHYHYFTVRQASWRQRLYFRHFLFFYGPGDHIHSLVWVLYSYPLNHLSIPFSLSVSFYFAVRSCSPLIYLILQFQPSLAVISRWLILGDNRIKDSASGQFLFFWSFRVSECFFSWSWACPSSCNRFHSSVTFWVLLWEPCVSWLFN